MKLIDSRETYAYGTSGDLVRYKDEIKCKCNRIGQYKRIGNKSKKGKFHIPLLKLHTIAI